MGGVSGNKREARPWNRPAAHSIYHHGLGDSSAVLVCEQHAGSFRREMLVTPCEQRDQYRTKIAPALRQHVFIADWLVAVTLALEHAALHQCTQAASQHVRCDIQTLLKFIEPLQAVNGVAQDEDAPPLAHPLQA